jgi:hypothetical protein
MSTIAIWLLNALIWMLGLVLHDLAVLLVLAGVIIMSRWEIVAHTEAFGPTSRRVLE